MLEPITQAHAAQLFDLSRDERLYEYASHYLPDSLEELRERFEQYANKRSRDGKHQQLHWVARRTQDHAYVGLVQATLRDDQAIQIGYMIFVPFWKMGYGKEAVNGVLDCLKSRYSARIAMTFVDVNNAASIALLEAVGFQQVGTGPSEYSEGCTDHRYERALQE